MFSSFSNSWQLFKLSWNILWHDKVLISLPFVSMILTFIATIVFFIPTSAIFGDYLDSESDQIPLGGFVILFFFYLIVDTIIIYFNSVLTNIVISRVNGKNISKSESFSQINAKLGSVIGFAVISATVGVILNIIKDRGGKAGELVSAIGGTAWNIATYLAIPVLVVEGVGPMEAVKKSAALLKKTWGQQLAGGFSMGIVMFLISIPLIFLGLLVIFIGAGQDSTPTILFGVGLTVFIVIILITISSALNAIFRAVLYKYAADGQVVPGFDPSLVQNAFKQKENKQPMI